MKYKVEHMTASGWADAEWTEESNGVTTPLRFNSKKEANEEISEHVADSKEAKARGDMETAYKRSDYRVVPVEDEDTPADDNEEPSDWITRHSVNCYFCSRLFDERDGSPADPYNDNDGGTICPDCFKTRTKSND